MYQQHHQQQQQYTVPAVSTGGGGQQRQRIMRPPFVDPQTNIIYDCDGAEYEGWLTKQSTWLKVSWPCAVTS